MTTESGLPTDVIAAVVNDAAERFPTVDTSVCPTARSASFWQRRGPDCARTGLNDGSGARYLCL